ncbi:MAG: hypothetical protein PF590_09285 [Candidatus Delongbacteria bacterium]|jgi:hypothetical protein|nr:hypothetical protein [Candidatus Delongbacteria bacterium]
MKEQPVLCFVDFTDITDNLKLWAGFVHKKTGRPIDLLFVRDNNTHIVFGSDVDDSTIEKKLDAFRTNAGITSGDNYIKEGCNCTLISSIAESKDAIYTLIPVHKYNDVQFLNGKTVVKMLRKSRIPGLIIPEKNKFTPPQSVSTIANFRRAQKITAPWLVHLSKYLDLKINMFMPANGEQQVKHNFSFLRQFCEDHGITPEPNTSASGIKTDKHLLKQLIGNIHMLHLGPQPGFFDRLFGDNDARLVSNKYGTPVFCVNSRDDLLVPCT